MRYLTAGAITLALALGVLAGVALHGGVFGVEAASEIARTISVHEVGTAKVEVQNFPPVQDVNVVALPQQPEGRLIELGTQTVGPSATAVFPFEDVSDCAQMRAMARAPFTGGLSGLSYNTSPDGSTGILADVFDQKNQGIVDGASTVYGSISGPHRFIQLLVDNPNSGIGADITAWIWCAP